MKIIRYIFGSLILLLVGMGIYSIFMILHSSYDDVSKLNIIGRVAFYSVFTGAFLLNLFCGFLVVRFLAAKGDRNLLVWLICVHIAYVMGLGLLWIVPVVGEGVAMATGASTWNILIIVLVAVVLFGVSLVEERFKRGHQES